jgi:putative drug exporter of the RND superfamily
MTMTTHRPDTATPDPTGGSGPAGWLARLAAWSYDHRRRVLVLWIGLLVVASAASGMVGNAYQDRFTGGNAESQQAEDLLQAKFPAFAGDNADVVVRTDGAVTSAANKTTLTTLVDKLKGLPHVAAVRSPFDQGGQGQISSDGHVAYAEVQFDQQSVDLPKAAIRRVIDTAEAARGSGFEVQLGGQPIEFVLAPSPGSTEFIGVAAAVVILLIAFGSAIAMGLPIVTALFGIGISYAVVAFLSHGLVVPSFGPQLAAMIGLGVGIDYALFIVTRYRQALDDGAGPRAAVIHAIDTSGRAVLFAGCTVVISLLGMMLLGVSFVYGLAFGTIAAVLLVLAGSLTLLPGMLGFAGHAIDRLRVPGIRARSTPSAHSVWYRWSREVQRRPVVSALGALAVLVLLALPVFSMQLLFTDAGNDPSNLTTRQAYDLLAEGFGPGTNGPLVVAVDLTAGGGQGVVNQLAKAIGSTPDVASVVPPQLNDSGDTAVIVAIPRSSPQAEATRTLVERLRDQVIPPATSSSGSRALVGGVTAAGVDAAQYFSERLIWVIGGVVLLSFLLLMVVFRSIAIPVKAAVMNMLSIGAAYGVIVAVFQWGWLGSVIGVQKGPIDPWIPLFLFTILFGLSMDYEVFLLSRIREQWLRTGDNATAVADGLALTARVITAAAAIMFCVFASFVFGDVRVLKVFGLGLAVAVLVDATIVRMVLVPATMELLGKANWWMPAKLGRVLPTVHVEGHNEVEGHHEPQPLAVPATTAASQSPRPSWQPARR